MTKSKKKRHIKVSPGTSNNLAGGLVTQVPSEGTSAHGGAEAGGVVTRLQSRRFAEEAEQAKRATQHGTAVYSFTTDKVLDSEGKVPHTSAASVPDTADYYSNSGAAVYSFITGKVLDSEGKVPHTSAAPVPDTAAAYSNSGAAVYSFITGKVLDSEGKVPHTSAAPVPDTAAAYSNSDGAVYSFITGKVLDSEGKVPHTSAAPVPDTAAAYSNSDGAVYSFITGKVLDSEGKVPHTSAAPVPDTAAVYVYSGAVCSNITGQSLDSGGKVPHTSEAPVPETAAANTNSTDSDYNNGTRRPITPGENGQAAKSAAISDMSSDAELVEVEVQTMAGKVKVMLHKSLFYGAIAVPSARSENAQQIEEALECTEEFDDQDHDHDQQTGNGTSVKSENRQNVDYNQPTQPYLMSAGQGVTANESQANQLPTPAQKTENEQAHQKSRPYQGSIGHTARKTDQGANKNAPITNKNVITSMLNDGDNNRTLGQERPGNKGQLWVESNNLNPGESPQHETQTPDTEHGHRPLQKYSDVMGLNNAQISPKTATTNNMMGDGATGFGNTNTGATTPIAGNIVINNINGTGNTDSAETQPIASSTLIDQLQDRVQGHEGAGEKGLSTVERNNLDPGDGSTQTLHQNNPEIEQTEKFVNNGQSAKTWAPLHDSTSATKHQPRQNQHFAFTPEKSDDSDDYEFGDAEWRQKLPTTQPPPDTDPKMSSEQPSRWPETPKSEGRGARHQRQQNIDEQNKEWQPTKVSSVGRIKGNKLLDKMNSGPVDDKLQANFSINQSLISNSGGDRSNESSSYYLPPPKQTPEPFEVWVDSVHNVDEQPPDSNQNQQSEYANQQAIQDRYTTPDLEDDIDQLGSTQEMEECDRSFQMVAELSAKNTVLEQENQPEVEFVFSEKELNKYNKAQELASQTKAKSAEAVLYTNEMVNPLIKWPEGPYDVQRATGMNKYTIHGLIPRDIAGVAMRSRNMHKNIMMCVTDEISIQAYISVILGDNVQIERTSFKLADERSRQLATDASPVDTCRRVWIGPPTMNYRSERTPYFIYSKKDEWNRLQNTETWYLGPEDRNQIQPVNKGLPLFTQTMNELEKGEAQLVKQNLDKNSKAKQTIKDRNRNKAPDKPFKEKRNKKDETDSEGEDNNNPQNHRQPNQPKRHKLQTENKRSSNVAVQTIDLGEAQENVVLEKTPEITARVRDWDKKGKLQTASKQLTDIAEYYADSMAILNVFIKPVESERVRSWSMENFQKRLGDSNEDAKIKQRWLALLLWMDTTIGAAQRLQTQLAVMPAQPIQDTTTIAKLSQIKIMTCTLVHSMETKAVQWPQCMQEIGQQVVELVKVLGQTAREEINRTMGQNPELKPAEKKQQKKQRQRQRKSETKMKMAADQNKPKPAQKPAQKMHKSLQQPVQQQRIMSLGSQASEVQKPKAFKERGALQPKTPPNPGYHRVKDSEFRDTIMKALYIRPVQQDTIDELTKQIGAEATTMHFKMMYLEMVGEALGPIKKNEIAMQLAGVTQEMLEEKRAVRERDQIERHKQTMKVQFAEPKAQTEGTNIPAEQVLFRDAPLQQDIKGKVGNNGQWTWDYKVYVHTNLGKGEQVSPLLFTKQVVYEFAEAQKANEFQVKLWTEANGIKTKAFTYDSAKHEAAELASQEHDVLHLSKFHDTKGRPLLCKIHTDPQDQSAAIRYIPIPEEPLPWFSINWIHDHMIIEGYYPNVRYYSVVSSPNDKVSAVFKPDEAGEVLDRSESEMVILKEPWMPLTGLQQ